MESEASIKIQYYKYFPFKSLIQKVIKKRTNFIVDSCENFIKEGGGVKVLDIGTGTGWIAEEIKKRKNVDIVLLDVVDFNQTDLKVIIYDGKIIPFEDNSFDTVLLKFVLHHTENPLDILKEAKRVSKNNIIIFEDTYNSGLGKFLLCVLDYISNLPSFFVKPFAENMPFNFKKVSDWKNIFKGFNLEVIFQKEFSQKFIKHILFVLKK